jgi:GTP cyclohydrolase I
MNDVDKPISQIIRDRMVKAKHRFHANDNVADFIKEGEFQQLQDELTVKFGEVLDSLLIDRDNDPNSNETGLRLAKMYLREIMGGRYEKAPKITTFPNEKYDETKQTTDADRPPYSYSGVLVVPAELTSMCSHHHQMVKGICYIGIIPGKKVMGLSKYVRIAQHLAKRGTLQEQLTEDVLKVIQEISETDDVAVMNISTHGCMTCRGVGATHAYTSTAELGGRFFDIPQLRAEFYSQIEILEKQRHSS